jgi:hypothetical protein
LSACQEQGRFLIFEFQVDDFLAAVSNQQPQLPEESKMNKTALKATTLNPSLGSRPRRYAPEFARLMREIRKKNPALADSIQAQIVAAQTAEKKACRLLAQYRLTKRHTPVLNFFKRTK